MFTQRLNEVFCGLISICMSHNGPNEKTLNKAAFNATSYMCCFQSKSDLLKIWCDIQKPKATLKHHACAQHIFSHVYTLTEYVVFTPKTNQAIFLDECKYRSVLLVHSPSWNTTILSRYPFKSSRLVASVRARMVSRGFPLKSDPQNKQEQKEKQEETLSRTKREERGKENRFT